MKVSIITEGFQNTGIGHIMRCMSLYQAFDARNIIPTFYINGDDSCKLFVQDTNYEIINWLENPDLIFQKVEKSDIIIVDSYLAEKSFYDRISELTPLPLYIDDNMRIEYPSGIVLNGSVYAESLKYPTQKNKIYLLGTKYIPIRKEFWDVIDKYPKIDLQSILITFGGEDVQNLTPRILKNLVRNYPEIRKKVVVGSGFQNLDQIEEAKDDLTEIYRIPTAGEMVKLMLDSDLAISAAGQTIYELARVGVPTIAIAVVENQLNNLSGWIKDGFLVADINYQNSGMEQKLLMTLLNFKKRPIREKLNKIGKQKVDGGGAKRVVQFLTDQITAKYNFYFRNANERDATLIFNLSNERIVRTNSINQSPIKWNEHLEWFSEKIKDENCMFLLAFDRIDRFIGQVRFDIKEGIASIGISIDKDFRGKRFSSQLIFNATFKLLKERNDVTAILAYIRPSNIPSIKSFLKSGYIFSHSETMGEEQFQIYKFSRQ